MLANSHQSVLLSTSFGSYHCINQDAGDTCHPPAYGYAAVFLINKLLCSLKQCKWHMCKVIPFHTIHSYKHHGGITPVTLWGTWSPYPPPLDSSCWTFWVNAGSSIQHRASQRPWYRRCSATAQRCLGRALVCTLARSWWRRWAAQYSTTGKPTARRSSSW